jgi:XTP/dITP diphosphohydrolase
MPQLLIATNNQGKQKEFRSLLEDLKVDLVTPSDLGINTEVLEDGKSYKENATKKAEIFSRISGVLSLADDSGLELDILGGAPGLYSARFSPKPNATDADRRAYLLSQLKDYPQPWTARFYCILVIANSKGILHFSEGICPGTIIPEERGEQGFGYDPIFLLASTGKTMAELSTEEKKSI